MTDRDLRFADEYMLDLNAKAAAIRAGYSPKTAKNASAWIGGQNPQKPKLKELIEKKQAELSRRTCVSAERLIREAMKIATADLTDLIDVETGKVLPDAARADTAALIGLRVKRGNGGTEYEAKMADKLKALEFVAKMTGCMDERLNINVSAPVIVEDIPEDEGNG